MRFLVEIYKIQVQFGDEEGLGKGFEVSGVNIRKGGEGLMKLITWKCPSLRVFWSILRWSRWKLAKGGHLKNLTNFISNHVKII